MRTIGIDYTAAVAQGAGIGRYTRELIGAALAQGGDFRFVLFFAAAGLHQPGQAALHLRDLCATYPHVRLAPIPLSHRRLTQLWQRLRIPLPVEIFTGPLDLLHSPDFVLPPTRARTLVTIHDLSFLIYPQFAAPGMVRYLSSAVPRALRRANHVIADSEATRRDLQRLLGVAPERVRVIYPGVTPNFRPLSREACEPVRRKLNLPDDYVVFVGTLSPRKNLVRLIEAFQILTSGTQRRTQLLLVGQRGWLDDEIFEAIDHLQMHDRVRLLNYVDDNDLPAVYNLARASVYPSLYEGFGIPALESLACGTPLVIADNSSLPEAAGNAAIMVDAHSSASIAEGLRRALDDDDLRRHLRHVGIERARSFTWELAARQLLVYYRS